MGDISALPAFAHADVVLADVTARVGADDLMAVRSYPPQLRKAIISHTGLRDPRSISKSVATGLERVLRGNDRRRRSSLIGVLSAPIEDGFDNHDELSKDDCVSLLSVDDAKSVLSRSCCFAAALRHTTQLPAPLVALMVAEMYGQAKPLSALALGLLTGTARHMGQDASNAVCSAWSQLRDLHPELPEVPISLLDLRDIASSLPTNISGSLVDTKPEPVEAAEQEISEMTTKAQQTPEKGDPTRALRAELTSLRQALQVAAAAADRVQRAFTATGRPLDQDLDLLLRGVQDFDSLRDKLETEHGATIPEATTEALQQVLDDLESANSQREEILALARISGPPPLDHLLQEVREAALAESPIVQILAQLIRLTGDPDAAPHIIELEERFQRDAPLTWIPLLTAVARGWLTVADGVHDVSSTLEVEPSSEDPSKEEGGSATTTSDELLGPPSGAEATIVSTDEDELAALDAIISDKLQKKPSGQPKAEVSGPPVDETFREVASAEPPVASMAPADAVTISGSAEDAEAFALRTGRFGLAAWIRDAAGRPSAEVNVRRCAAIAAEMSEFAGRLSAAFAESADGLSMKALGDDSAGQLLAWAAALRTGLIQPTPEAAQLLDDLSPALSSYPGLAAYGDGFSTMARAGAYLMPGLSGRMHDTSQAEANRIDASTAAAKLLNEGPSQKIKFALATEVWKTLLQADSSGLGKLLAIAAHDDASMARDANQELDKLRAGTAINRLIDETAKVRGSTRIHSGARAKLIEKIDKALGIVADWVTAAREAESSRTDDSGVSWIVKHLNDLRAIVAENKEHAQEDLTALVSSSDPLIAAAAVGAKRLIDNTLRLLDGGPLERAEPLAAHVLNGDLLLSPTIRFAAETLTPRTKPSLDELVSLCTPDNRDWRAAFEARAALGDHEGTRALLNVLTRQDQVHATELRQRRDKLVDSARHERTIRIEDIQDRIAQWRRDGVLSEVVSTHFSARLHALGSDEREDFGAIADHLTELEEAVAQVHADEIAAEQNRLRTLSADNSDVAAVQDRIRRFVEIGDLTTAREFTAQAKAGKELPEISSAVDHLEKFFPHFPQAFEDISTQVSGRQRGREGGEWLQKLKGALATGGEITDPDLDGLLSRTGLSVSGIPLSRRRVADNGLRLWRTVAQGPKAAGNFKSAIAAILQMIGIEGEQDAADPEQNRQWITLSQVNPIGDPLLPTFGSRMSPSGNRLRLLLVWKPPGPQQVIESLKDQPEDQTVVVLYFGVLSAEQRRQLATLSRRRPAPVAAVLDDAAIGYLACLPDANWATTVSLLAPFTAANPYAPTGEVPEEMFYGRQDQLREVTSRTGSSFVYGGRQLGKSALLRKAERKVRETDVNRKVISEIIQNIGRVTKVTALWPLLAGKLADAEVLPRSAASLTDPKEICRKVREWIDGDPARQLLILLDEADEFLDKDARDSFFANVIALRDLMHETDHRVKVVFAGLHQTARFESLPNQPFAHLGTPVAVGPLDPQDAYNLLTEPLAALGFRFPARLAARVIAEANNAPALIQLFADALLTRLRRISTPNAPLPYEISREDVDAVWRDNKLARGFRDRFEWTLNLDKRYKVIAYTVAFHALGAGTDVTLTANELRNECQQWWLQGFRESTSDGFRGLLDECVNLGVLASDGEGYRLRTPHILNLLGGADEVETVLGQAEAFELPDSFDAQSYRDAYKSHGERSPLTGSQVTLLLSPRNVLHLIAGSSALQIDRVATALEEAASRQARTHRVGIGGLTFDGAVQRAAQGSDHNIVIADLTGLTYRKANANVRLAANAISIRTRGTLSVVLIAPPEHASEWLSTGRRPDAVGSGTGDLIELQRFNRPAIRQWMHEAGLGFQDEPSQDTLLRTTGGWPLLISKVIHALTSSNADRDHALESCRTYVDRAPEEFVRSTGVLSGKALSAAWHTLVEQADIADTSETLAELLALAGADEGAHPLSEAGLQEEGYISTEDLVEVLRILGALVVQDDGKLRLEPVLMKATQRMGLGQ
ncbi:hypothetical protein [Nonomuraea cavernae]|uniref:hypothetical protein n=1 Tax=Nonomuraea cavernae TaxID=2045107 RepID=UPI0033FD4651